MSDKNVSQLDISKFVTIESEGNLILLKPNQMLTLYFKNEKGEFQSIMVSPLNLCNLFYDSVGGKTSSTAYFDKHSEKD